MVLFGERIRRRHKAVVRVGIAVRRQAVASKVAPGRVIVVVVSLSQDELHFIDIFNSIKHVAVVFYQ
jgi:hypothetical protein